MLEHAQANGLALGVEQTSRQLLRALKDEGVRTRRGGLEQTVLAVVLRVGADFGQIATHQGEMTIIDADLADAIKQTGVAGGAHQGVSRWWATPPTRQYG